MSQASPLQPARRRAQELGAAGDLAGARAILEKAVELGRANLAEDDPDLLLTSCHLGQLYQRLDDPSAARRVLEEAYANGQLRLGDHDPLMVEISYEIGVVAEELGNRHEARKAFTRVAEYGPAALGATHPAVARAQAYLGHTPDSVRPSAPPLATQPVPVNPVETHLTLVTPIPSAPPFGVEEPTATLPVTRAFVEPPPTTDPIWTPPTSPPVRRSPTLDESTVASPIVTPRPRNDAGRNPQADLAGSPFAPRPETSLQQAPPQWNAQAQVQPDFRPAPVQLEFGQAERQPDFRPAQAGSEFRQVPPGTDFGAATRPEFQQGGRQGSEQRQPEQWMAAQQLAPAVILQPSRGDGEAYRKRGLGIFAAIAAVMASLIAVAALVFVLANRNSNNNAPASNVPTLAGKAPTGVKLRDLGNEVDVSWTDPSPGQVSFIVVMGHPGEELVPTSPLGPGTTFYRAGGLNAKLNYCFAVAAVYSAKTFATSPQSCTSRGSATTAPSTGK